MSRGRPDHLGVSVLCLWLGGLWPGDAPSKLYHCFTAFAFLVGLTFIGGQLVEIFDSYGDFHRFTKTLSFLISVLNAVSRAAVFRLNWPNVRRLMDALSSPELVHAGACDQWSEGVLRSKKRNTDALTLSLGILMAITVVAWSALSVYTSFWGSKGAPELPMEAAVPFDISDPFNYGVALAYQVLTMIPVGFFAFSVDAFFSTIAFHLCGQLEILNREIRERLDESQVARVIRYHQAILKCVAALESAQRITTLILLLAHVGVICITAFVLTSTDKVDNMLKYMFYLTVAISQVLVYCWYYQLLSTQSSELAFSAYSCSWEDKDAAVKNCTRSLIRQAHRPVRLTAGSIFSLNMETFLELMRVSYSLFTVLHQVNKSGA